MNTGLISFSFESVDSADTLVTFMLTLSVLSELLKCRLSEKDTSVSLNVVLKLMTTCLQE